MLDVCVIDDHIFQAVSKDHKAPSDKDKSDPAWSVLREDFMMGAKMKDWDKDSDSEGGGSPGEEQEDSDSDS